MAFRLAINPPELNPRLKLQPESAAGLERHFTASTLWKEIGNSRLRFQDPSPQIINQAVESRSINRRQR